MKKTAALFSLFLISLFSFGQNGVTCLSIPPTLIPSGDSYNNQAAFDTSGKILFCTNKDGLIVFDGTNFTSFRTSNSGIASDKLVDVVVDTTTNLSYIASQDSGLIVFDGTSWLHYDSLHAGIVSNKLRCLLIRNGVIYVGSNHGFSTFENGVFTNYSTANSALCNDTINCFEIDSNNTLWVGTKRGLSSFDGTSFNSLSNFNNENIFSLRFADHNLWIFGNNIYRFKNGFVKSINDIFGSPANLYNFNELGLSFNGGLFIISFNGLVEFLNNQMKVQYPKLSCAQNSSYSFAAMPSTGTICLKSASRYFILYKPQLYQAILPYNYFWAEHYLNYYNCKNLDISQTKAIITNRETNFYFNGNEAYEVPKGSGKNAVLANSFWIGGKDSAGVLHMAAQTYNPNLGWDYWPGPLDTLFGNTDTATTLKYDRVWKINRYDIEQFKLHFQNGSVQNGNFIPATDILDWPAIGSGNYTRKMAPFVDVNQDGLYNPIADGDYPLIKGDQMLYWIFNDNFSVHTAADGIPLKIEVHASAYAYACPNLITRDSIINYSTFYNFKVFNRSSLDYDSCYLSNWTDFAVGDPDDDLIGTNPANNFMYACNKDSVDVTFGINHYGTNPPIMSNVILKGPPAFLNDTIDNDNDGIIDETGEENLLTSSMIHFKGWSANNSPESNPIHYYDLMKAKWRDGSHLTFGGSGHMTGNPTNYMFPNFPSDSAAWIQNYTYGYYRANASSGPFLFPAGSSFDYDFAFVFSRDTTLTYNSPAYYQMAVSDVQRVKYWFDNNNAPSCLVFPGVPETYLNNNNILLFPNPANTLLNIQFQNAAAIQTVNVFNLVGQQVKPSAIKIATKAHVQLDIQSFSPGIYFIGLIDNSGKYSYAKFIKE